MLEGELIQELQVGAGIDLDLVRDKADPDLRANAAHADHVVTGKGLEGLKVKEPRDGDTREVNHARLH